MTKSVAGAGIVAIIAAVVLAACGSPEEQKNAAPQAPTFAQAGQWTVQARGAVVERRGEELVTLVPSAEVVGYQANHEIALSGQSSLVLRIDATAQGGRGFIGVLSADRSRWLQNVPLLPDVRTIEEVSVPLQGAGDRVFLVLQTHRGEPVPTTIVVHNLEYALQ